ncbi:MAG TPA: TRAP transporter small permease [Alphaproteobacteria bacterium]|nr:TRAP transporter small permease [Alphaproteobacteria bacterium]
MIDRLFARLARAIELLLALAFIAAVALNFVNVVGRYLLGWTILGADEVQIFIMVGMTFLGAVVVTWREQHLRMDVIARLCPAPVQALLRWSDLTLLAVLCGFVFYESATYAYQMFRLGRLSDTADVPMWIPHGAVALGFGLITLIAVWRGVVAVLSHRRVQDRLESGARETPLT